MVGATSPLSQLKSCCQPPISLEAHFQKVDLIKNAFFEEELHPDKIDVLKPLISHLVHHLVAKNSEIPFEEQLAIHEPYYRMLSTITYAEPLRQVYRETLELYKNRTTFQLITQLASIPNSNGERQSHRIEDEQLQAAIWR